MRLLRLFTFLGVMFLAQTFSSHAANADLQSLLKEYENYVESMIKEWNVPGLSLAIVKDGEVIYAKGFGVKAVGSKDPVDEQTIFQIGSISKSFTSALVAKFVDENVLKWEDHVVDHLPDFMMYDPWVTREFQIEDLLCQRSGLAPYSGDAMFAMGFDELEMIQGLRYLKPISSFRSKFAYQNIPFQVAARILKNHTGKSFEDLLDEHLFKPLGMNSTTATLADYLAAKNSSKLHRRLIGTANYTVLDTAEEDWVYHVTAAGGINSNILDMAKWTICMANLGEYQGKKIISKENAARMQRPHVFAFSEEMADSYYCLGLVYRTYSPYPILWHNGGTSGVHNQMAFIPQEKLGLVILSNARENPAVDIICWQFFDLYYGKPDQHWNDYYRKIYEEKEKQAKAAATFPNPLPPMKLDQYTGSYHNELYGTVKVSAEKNQLVVTIGKNNSKLILKPWDRDVFSLFMSGEDNPGETKVLFTIGQDGKPQTMTINMLEGIGTGVFVRQ